MFPAVANLKGFLKCGAKISIYTQGLYSGNTRGLQKSSSHLQVTEGFGLGWFLCFWFVFFFWGVKVVLLMEVHGQGRQYEC